MSAKNVKTTSFILQIMLVALSLITACSAVFAWMAYAKYANVNFKPLDIKNIPMVQVLKSDETGWEQSTELLKAQEVEGKITFSTTTLSMGELNSFDSSSLTEENYTFFRISFENFAKFKDHSRLYFNYANYDVTGTDTVNSTFLCYETIDSQRSDELLVYINGDGTTTTYDELLKDFEKQGKPLFSINYFFTDNGDLNTKKSVKDYIDANENGDVKNLSLVPSADGYVSIENFNYLYISITPNLDNLGEAYQYFIERQMPIYVYFNVMAYVELSATYNQTTAP